jgi:hypothetical protein
MPRLFLALLIALLPLRGWVGETMATDMAAAWTVQHHLSAQAIVMLAADAVVVDAHDHCTSHEATAAEEASAPASHAECSTCASCQACHAVALVAGSTGLTGQPLPMAPPVARHHAFSSAAPAPGLKPPIS